MSNKKIFDSIVGEQFPTSRWASLGLEATYPGIDARGPLGKYVTGLFLGYNATRDNDTKYRKLIAKGTPADQSLLDAQVRASHRIKVFTDIYDEVTFDLKDTQVSDATPFDTIVTEACFARYYRTECLLSIDDREKDKLNAITTRLEGLFVEERTRQFSEILEFS